MSKLTAERISELHQKLTLLTGAKGEGDSEFTFQDFYDIEELIKRNEAARAECKKKIQVLTMQVESCVGSIPREWNLAGTLLGEYKRILEILEG